MKKNFFYILKWIIYPSKPQKCIFFFYSIFFFIQQHFLKSSDSFVFVQNLNTCFYIYLYINELPPFFRSVAELWRLHANIEVVIYYIDFLLMMWFFNSFHQHCRNDYQLYQENKSWRHNMYNIYMHGFMLMFLNWTFFFTSCVWTVFNMLDVYDIVCVLVPVYNCDGVKHYERFCSVVIERGFVFSYL